MRTFLPIPNSAEPQDGYRWQLEQSAEAPTGTIAPIRPSAIRLPPYVTIAIVDRTNATVWPRLPACPRRSAEMGGIIDRLCEREPVIRVK